MKYHRCKRNGHGPVPLNNEQRFKFAMQLHPGCPPLWSTLDLCSHGTQRQSVWIKLTTVSIATAFTQINPISRNNYILRFDILQWKHNARSAATPRVPLHQPSWLINMSKPITQFEVYFISSLKTYCARRMARDRHACWRTFRTPHLKCP